MSRLEQACVIAALLAGAAMYLVNRQWPEQPLPLSAFLILWLAMLIAICLVGLIWRRARSPDAKNPGGFPPGFSCRGLRLRALAT
jgi:hypothetical protein